MIYTAAKLARELTAKGIPVQGHSERSDVEDAAVTIDNVFHIQIAPYMENPFLLQQDEGEQIRTIGIYGNVKSLVVALKATVKTEAEKTGLCKCRNCGKKYDNQTSRAWYTGYCSQKCLREKAKALGWHESKKKVGGCQIYRVIMEAGQVGNVPWKEPKPFPAPLPDKFVPPTKVPNVAIDNAIKILAKHVLKEGYHAAQERKGPEEVTVDEVVEELGRGFAEAGVVKEILRVAVALAGGR
jgi:hypothetical protein